MGLRFKKSIKIVPGIKVNIGKNSVGISAGNKYGGVSVNSKTGVTKRTSIPGTGISYTERVSGTKAESNSQKSNSSQAKASPVALRVLGTLLLIVGIAVIVTGATIGKAIGFDIMLYIGGSICSLLGIFYIVSSMKKK